MKKNIQNVSTISNNNTLIKSPLLLNLTADQWEQKESKLLGQVTKMAETESRKISERTKNGINACLREGYYMASAPFGYSRENRSTKHDKQRQVLEPDGNAVFVKEAFRRVADGEHRTAVYEDMKKRYNIKLPKSSFLRMFANLGYNGKIFCKEFKEQPALIVDGKHDAIIDDLLFQKVQVAITKTFKNN